MSLIAHIALAAVVVVVLASPAWWMAGSVLGDDESARSPFWRLLWALGFVLVGYVSFVNLIGHLAHNSTGVASAYIALNLVGAVLLHLRDPARASWAPLFRSWRQWIAVPAIALVFALPQLVYAVSTNYWDEAASSSIHLTAPNQFAEGVFPPQHNALPGIVIKYHYGFTILSGTVRWLTGLSANVSVDVASTLLWLFVFAFVLCWLRQLGFSRFASLWAGCATMFGGGLQWLYLHRIEAYSSVAKLPAPSELVHAWQPGTAWLTNLVADAREPTLFLRNADGTLSGLPWEAVTAFQQHAVPLGLALTVFSFALFIAWQRSAQGLRSQLTVWTIATFGLLGIGHGAYGAMAAFAAGMWLLGAWIVRRTRVDFLRGLLFGVGVGAVTLLHGGLFERGAQYGSSAAATLRHSLGYPAGGASGFVHWNLAGFGIPLLLALVAWTLRPWHRDPDARDRNMLFALLTILGVTSWGVPHLVYYSSDTIGAEQFTEVMKFFFVARLAFAMLSAYGIAIIVRRVPWPVLVPTIPAMSVIALAHVYAGSVRVDGSWLGFYRAPYYPNSVEQQMGDTLRRLKHGPRDVYFDASGDERAHGYLGELLVFGGSIFTLTPSRYERTGVGYRLAEDVTARRLVQNGRMARLEPRAPEECSCTWYYTRPEADMAGAQILVRSRFDKLVAEGYFKERFVAAPRALYEIVRPTADLDAGLDRYWKPRIVTQPRRHGAATLTFFDRANNRIVSDGQVVPLPDALKGQSLQLYTGKFAGDTGTGFVVGRMQDTYFKLGRRVEDLVERSAWSWTYRAAAGAWGNEYSVWLWDWDIPFVADLNNDGMDSQIGFRVRTSEWIDAAGTALLPGPQAKVSDFPIPFGGRFLAGSQGDLGLWSFALGTVTLRSVQSGASVTFRWGGRTGDVLVPGDYDGDGMDEIAVWQRTNQTWYWKHAPEGTISQATYGSASGVPLPADYNGDGRLDLAYWEPTQGKIYVSFTQGRTIDRVIVVPPGSIPAFVNMN